MTRFPRYRLAQRADFAGGALATIAKPMRPKIPGVLGRAKSFAKTAIGGAKRRTGAFLSARPKLRTGIKKVAYGAGAAAGTVKRKVSSVVSRVKRPRLPGTSFSTRRSRQIALFARIDRDRKLRRRRPIQ